MMAFHSNQRYIVENLLEELDQPGEWCFNSQEGKLYFWPPDNAAAPSDVVAPLLDGLISLRGTSTLVLSGFTLPRPTAATTSSARGWTAWERCTPCRAGNTAARPCAGTRPGLPASRDNRFAHLGGNAVCLNGACLRNMVCGNDIAEVGACGVMMGSQPVITRCSTKSPTITSPARRHKQVPHGVLLGLSKGT